MNHRTTECRSCRLLAAGCAVAAGLLSAPDAGAKTAWPAYAPRGDAKRAEVPAAYRWNLSHMFASIEVWEKAFAGVDAEVPSLAPCRETIAKDAASLAACLDRAFEGYRVLGRLQAWADAVHSVDQSDSDSKARSDRANALATRWREATSFIEPALLAMDPATLAAWVKATPGLAKYAHYLDDLNRRRPHVLPAEQERLLALTGDLRGGPSFVYSALDVDVKFPSVTGDDGKEAALSKATFPRFRGSKNRDVRREATAKFFATLKAYSHAFAASLDMQVKANIFNAKARNYGSALEASVDSNAVPTTVYENLVTTVERNLPKTLHRYVELRKRVLGLPEIHYYDLYTPLFPAAREKASYPEGVDMTLEALKPLGKDYMKVIQGGLDPANGWVDVFPNVGKRSGAYCNASYRDHPIVFLNHMDELEDVFTLVHEFGHALHFHMSHQAQEFANADAPIFLAEIASTFNEELLLDHLLKKAKGRDERLNLLNKRIENLRTTIFRQVMFAEYELAIHREVEGGGALTSERMAEIYGMLVRKYYGPGYTFDADDGYEWAYIPHFYYNFYVYQYATGLISAIALSRPVLAGDAAAAKRYLHFLASGGSDFPIPTLKAAGVDLTAPDSMQPAFDLFAATLDEIERTLAEPR